LLFNPETGERRFFQNVGTFLPDYIDSYSEDNNLHIHPHEALNSQIPKNVHSVI
jgi:hypothetical protein